MPPKAGEADKKARLAEALRANLQRRKQQARRRSMIGQTGDGQPVENPPQSPGTSGKPA